jgi:hypothetical protein
MTAAQAVRGGRDVNALNKIGGALLLAGLAVAVIIGFQTPTGRQFWDGVWQAAATVVGFVGDQVGQLNGTSVAGNGTLAIAIAAVGMIVLLVFLPKPVSTRLFTAAVIGATVLAIVLYQPSIVSGIGG